MMPTTQCHPVRTAFSDGQYPAPLFRMPALHVLSRGSMMINPFLKTESYQALQQALTAGVGPLAVTGTVDPVKAQLLVSLQNTRKTSTRATRAASTPEASTPGRQHRRRRAETSGVRGSYWS